MPPLVSILIPVHDCEQWLVRAIESALAQTWTPCEVIVLDDGSTDRSLDVAARYAKHIRLERRPQGGQNRARNELTRLSRGDWLCFLDADDELEADCIEAKMRACDTADAIYGSHRTAIFEGTRLVQASVRAAGLAGDPWVAALLWQYPNTSAFLFRRTALLAAGGWNESVRVCTDYDLYFRLLLQGSLFAAVPESLSMYRHWSHAQAVHVSPLARVTMRMQLMTESIERLASRGELTTERQHAYEQSTLRCIRALYRLDRTQAQTALSALVRRNARVSPSVDAFPRPFVLAYRLGGLQFAETLAHWRRAAGSVMRRESTHVIDYDAGSTMSTPSRIGVSD